MILQGLFQFLYCRSIFLIPQNCRPLRPAIFLHIFSFHLYQDNIIPHLQNIAERNHIFFLPSQETTEAAWTGYNDSCHTAIAHIKVHITYKPQPFAVLRIDNFLLFQLRNSQTPQNLPLLFGVSYAALCCPYAIKMNATSKAVLSPPQPAPRCFLHTLPYRDSTPSAGEWSRFWAEDPDKRRWWCRSYTA